MLNPHRSHLPPEIFDYTVDLLHDQPETLKQCCLVSSSWIPRARKHLFADVWFGDRHYIERWKKAFPDSTRSPAHYTRTLRIRRAEAVTGEDMQEGGWLMAFSRVVELVLRFDSPPYRPITLAPLHKLSPSIKSLHVFGFSLPSTQLFHLVRSLPLLDNLAINGRISAEQDLQSDGDLSTSPTLTGTLELTLPLGFEIIARGLLDLPNGLRFRKLILSWSLKELRWMNELVAACSETLECVDFKHALPDDPRPDSIDLSKAIMLRDVIFRPALHVGWITATLETIMPKHRGFRRISIDMGHGLFHSEYEGSVRSIVRGEAYEQWMELDRLLVEFWESRSIRLGVVPVTVPGKAKSTEVCCRYLLPEMTKRGIIDFVELYASQSLEFLLLTGVASRAP